jgi:hypothetical protein
MIDLRIAIHSASLPPKLALVVAAWPTLPESTAAPRHFPGRTLSRSRLAGIASG